MDGRFPFDSQGGAGQRHQQAQLQAALEMEEALYRQRHHEMQRDLQIRQMLLQDQLDQQMLQQQRMYEIQNYSHPALAALQEEQLLLQQQEQLRRHQQIQQELQISAALQSPARRNLGSASTDALVADALAAQQSGRPSSFELQESSPRKRPLTGEEESLSSEGMKRSRKYSKKKSGKTSPATIHDLAAILPLADLPTKKKGREKAKTSPKGQNGDIIEFDDDDKKIPSEGIYEMTEEETKELEEAARLLGAVRSVRQSSVEALADAAEAEQKVNTAAGMMAMLKEVYWSESESEDDEETISINLGAFRSRLPRLPQEPEYDMSESVNNDTKAGKIEAARAPKDSKRDNTIVATETKHHVKLRGTHITNEQIYPYPLDTWWPSNTTVRRERRVRGERSDEEDAADEPLLTNEEEPSFRGDLKTIRKRLATTVEPGVLEKVPHCRIHHLRHRHQKGGKAEPPVFCWQVTETSCNDIMVCCSVCSTWRHAGCGGHYKPYTIRGQLHSNAPFTPVCDRCNEEEKLLRDYPKAQTRIDRQRTEQVRRALTTSAVIRQASFSKHGGTYKWPLGSVSATHIGGHTRSVHSRHDKAERQWAEMAVRLGRGMGYRPKERSKIRTRELERLLVSVEDSEGIMDRHNMLLFLQQDTGKERPVGFERPRRNLFDPEDDHATCVPNYEPQQETESHGSNDRHDDDAEDSYDDEEDCNRNERKRRACARSGCHDKPRFDSIFCSDSCGVSALEFDLLRAMEYGGDIHPSLLRS